MTCGTVVLLPGMMCDERLFAYQAEGLKQEAQRSLEVIIPRLDGAESVQGLALKYWQKHRHHLRFVACLWAALWRWKLLHKPLSG